MLTLNASNRLEPLLERVVASWGQATGSVFERPTVVVPSAAVQRRLVHLGALQWGVQAQVDFVYLSNWLWAEVARWDPERAAHGRLSPELLRWQVLAALNDSAWCAAHPRLQAYVEAMDGLPRWAMAQAMASTLDQTLLYRPHWWAAWARGQRPEALGLDLNTTQAQDWAWQADLWRRVLDHTGGPDEHPALSFLASVQHRPLAPAQTQPVQVLALSALPPLQVKLIQAIGTWTDVQVMAMNPCQGYWLEVMSPKQRARWAHRGGAAALEDAPPLLAAWGLTARDQWRQWIEVAGDGVEEEEHFVPPRGSHLLAQLQRSVLDFEPPPPGGFTLAKHDDSLLVHRCHSRLRELEVLHEQVLHWMADDPSLKPSDVLVVMPDLEEAAPLVEAVWGTVPSAQRIPFALSGRALDAQAELRQAVLAVLRLLGSRFEATDTLETWLLAPVARRWGLGVDDAARWRRWLHQSGVHWGLNHAHREALGCGHLGPGTWDDGWQRALQARLWPAHEAPPRHWAGLSAASDAQALGADEDRLLLALGDWLQALEQARTQLATEAPATAWPARLRLLIGRFVQASDAEAQAWLQLHQAVADLERQWQAAPPGLTLSAPVVAQALEQALSEALRGGVPLGEVTFTSMNSLRHLSYRVVCVLGLDRALFPRRSTPQEFDLTALQPQPGDRRPRQDDRQLMLDLLMAAHDRLHLSHVGRSVNDDSEMAPSVLVNELLDAVVQGLCPADASTNDRQAQREALCRSHPLHSPRWRATVQAAAEAPLFTQALPPADRPLRLRLDEVVAFYLDPSQSLLSHGLGLARLRPDGGGPNEEALAWTDREHRRLGQQVLDLSARGHAEPAVRAWAEHLPALPVPPWRAEPLARALQVGRGLAQRVRQRQGPQLTHLPAHEWTLKVEGEDITVWMPELTLHAGGQVLAWTDKPRVGHELQAWIGLVAWQARGEALGWPADWLQACEVHRLYPDEEHHHAAVPDALPAWVRCLAWLRLGLRQPLPFFPRTSQAYAKAFEKAEDEAAGVAAARMAWEPTPNKPGAEGDFNSHRWVWRDREPPWCRPRVPPFLPGPSFHDCARSVFGGFADPKDWA